MYDQADPGERGFCRVDNAVIDEYGAAIGPYGLAVYLVLLRCSDADAYSFPSYSYIAKRTGISVRKVASVVKDLAALGLVDIGDRRKHASNGYTLRDMHDVHTPMQDVHDDMHQVHTNGDTPNAPGAYPMHDVHTPHAPGAYPPCTTCIPPMHVVHTNKTQLTIPTDQDLEEPEGIVGAAPTPTAPDSWDEWLQALCWVCHGHEDVGSLTKDRLGALTTEAKKMAQAGTTRAHLRRWWTTVWTEDWRWRKDRQRPYPADVRSSIASTREEMAAMAAMMEHAAQPVASPEPSRPDEPWRMVVKELLRTLPHDSPARGWLADSELAATGQVDGVPVYQVQLSNSAGVSWIRDRFGVRLRREVSALAGTQVLVEVVA